MGRARADLVAAVRQDLATARGAARAALAAAESARAQAHQHRQVVRDAYATCLAQLAGARDAARLDVLRRFHRESTSLSGNVETIAATCAAGAAGTSWRSWGPTEPERDRQPGLLRIGMISYDSPAPPGHRAPPRRTVLPALIPLLDQANLELHGEPATVDAMVAGLLLRALGSTHPGDVRLSVFDPGRLGGALAGFTPLADAGLLRTTAPGGLGLLLDDLVGHIRRIDETVLGGRFGSLTELAAATPGRRPEPWRVAVLLVDADTARGVTDVQRAQLDRIVRTGVTCGVHLIVHGLTLAGHPSVERVVLRGRTASCDSTGELPVRLDPAPPPDRVADFCSDVSRRMTAGLPPTTTDAAPVPADAGPIPAQAGPIPAQAGPIPAQAGPIPAQAGPIPAHATGGGQAAAAPAGPRQAAGGTGSSAPGLTAPLGTGTDGAPIELSLGDEPAHALIGGPAGSGKTNLIHAWLGALATRYGPDELALYLLDFQGAAFTQLAAAGRLPQLRLAGVNLGADREFGVAVLRHLDRDLRRRIRAGRRHGTATLAGLRAADPGGRWPRIVVVLDGFPVLVSGGDPAATQASVLLETLARRAGAHGIHLVLAGRDLSGVEALWGRPALADRLSLRLALPRARRVLAPDNLAADVIDRFHAVVNSRAGASGANRVVRVPDTGDHAARRHLPEQLPPARPNGPGWLFDGAAVPVLPRPVGVTGTDPVAALGECLDVPRRPATLALGRTPGRHLAVLGTRTDEACDVLAAAALSLAEQGPARFSLACLDPAALGAARALLPALPQARWFDADTVADLLVELTDPVAAPAAEIPHYVLGYGWDAVTARLAARPADGQLSGRDRLRALLTHGPSRRVHLLGWWRGVFRLRGDLGGRGAAVQPIGAWVALDVPGAELGPLSPQPGGPVWQPRPRRALFFDRSTHRAPEVIIPYRVRLAHQGEP